MSSMRTFASLATAALLTIGLPPVAAGITQRQCYGFPDSGGGTGSIYRVVASFSQTQGDICKAFKTSFKKECDVLPPACFAQNGLVAVAVSLAGRTPSDSFNCVELAMRDAQAATGDTSGNFNGGSNGFGCQDLNLNAVPPVSKRDVNETHIWLPEDAFNADDAFPNELSVDAGLSSEHHMLRHISPAPNSALEANGTHQLFRRAIIDSSTVLAIGDTIQVSSGQTLELFFAVTDNALQRVHVLPGISLSLMGQTVGAALGTVGQSIDALTTTVNSAFAVVDVIFDANLNGGPGTVNADDWTKIITAMANTLASRDGRNIVAIFKSNGIAVLNVFLTMVPLNLPIGSS